MLEIQDCVNQMPQGVASVKYVSLLLRYTPFILYGALTEKKDLNVADVHKWEIHNYIVKICDLRGVVHESLAALKIQIIIIIKT